MCGIAGLLAIPGALSEAALTARAAAMGDALAHRGPDAGAAWADAAAGIGLAHRRLAIVDLSPAGAQPMVSHCGRYVIVFNGEVYNAPDLRAALAEAGHTPPWRGHSDTEAMLEACARWGVEAAAARFIGMFAFALWDRAERRLWLVRDRLGIKPLYVGRVGGAFAFASELKALRTLPGGPGPDGAWSVDHQALAACLRLGYVPAPRSIWAGIEKLPPGAVLCLDRADAAPRLTRFWSLEAVARAGLADPLDELSDAAAVDHLHALLADAVSRRMVADVPLGAFLSGGIDSSLVVALMQAASARPVRTFTIGFAEAGYDEAAHAAAVAAHLGTDHTRLTVSPADALAVIPDLPRWWDEPFADGSAIPTLLLSRLTRDHVTVALSGDGGDELFAGYARHGVADRLWPRLTRVPRPARTLAAGAISALPPAGWEALARLLPAGRRPFAVGARIHKLAAVLGAPDLDAVYRRLTTHGLEPAGVLLHPDLPREPWPDAGSDLALDPVARMQFRDTLSYLPDDVLTKVDRASMAVALEARVPLLDHRVVEWSWRLPARFKRRAGRGKWLLRQVLHRHVPAALVERPKMGFAVPLGAWLRGPLRPWAEDLLAPARLAAGGHFAPAPIAALWRAHLSGRTDHAQALWVVLMIQAWLAGPTGPTGNPGSTGGGG